MYQYYFVTNVVCVTSHNLFNRYLVLVQYIKYNYVTITFIPIIMEYYWDLAQGLVTEAQAM